MNEMSNYMVCELIGKTKKGNWKIESNIGCDVGFGW